MSILYKLFEAVLNILPDSPVQGWVEAFKSAPWLGYLNFFLPISFMVNSTAIWVGLIFSYHVAKVAVSFVRDLLKG